MFTLRISLSLLSGAALIACAPDSNPTAARASSPRLSDVSLSEGESGPSATGHADVIQQPSGAKRTFSFEARVMPDGSVQGFYDNHNRQLGFVNHGSVDCMRFINDHDVVMSGVVERSTNPANPPGATAIFRVIDNGEGADDPPDRISQLAIFAPGPNCNTVTPMATLADIVGGNIQVRP
jgi:hypothetical protein